MQQEKNKTKASPAAAREVCHFSTQSPALWEQPPRGLWRESGSCQKRALSGALCAGDNPSFPHTVMSLGLRNHWWVVHYWTMHPGFSGKTLLPAVWHTPSCEGNMQSKCIGNACISPIWLTAGKILIVLFSRTQIGWSSIAYPWKQEWEKGKGWLSYKPNSLSPMTKTEAQSDKWAGMQW